MPLRLRLVQWEDLSLLRWQIHRLNLYLTERMFWVRTEPSWDQFLRYFLFFQQVLGSRWLMVDTKQVYYGMPHRMVTWCKSQYRRMKRKSGVMSCRALCAVQQGLHCSLLSLHTWPEVIRGHGAVDIRESRPLYKEMPIAPSVQWAPYMEPVASN